ncbi:NDP-sugar synthase [Streptomyces asoensis]|uniref:nucleotidyltransferase family protein n=1 Tax=Streptomyces asoensis TaxID=249586 RepID=UPI0033FD8CBA
MQKAITVVGGKGTRLRPLTNHNPKPLLSVASSSFVRHQVAKLMDTGVERLVFATPYLADHFEEEFRGFTQDLDISYAIEEIALDTGRAIRDAGRLLGGPADTPILVLNGDILSGANLRAFHAHHEANEADVLHLTREADASAFGLVPTDGSGRMLSTLKKPEAREEYVTDHINAGRYVFHQSIAGDQEVYGEQENIPGLAADGERVFSHTKDDYGRDLGTPLAFVHWSADPVTGRATSPLVGPPAATLIHPTAAIDPSVYVTGGSSIGTHAVIGPHVDVNRSIVGANVSVAEGTQIHESVVDHGSSIGSESSLSEAVVGCPSHVGAQNELPTQLRQSCGIHIPAQGVHVTTTAAACLTAH